MDDTLLFIPPCCADKKLPKAIAQAPRYALTFYTHADVTMEKFYRAVSYLVVDRHVMVVTMPNVSAEVFAFFAQCFDRGWISDLVLSIRGRAETYVEKYLKQYRSHVLFVSADDVSDISSHMVLYNGQQSLVINGPMFYRPQTGVSLAQYVMTFHPNYTYDSESDWGNHLRNVLFPDVLRMRHEFLPSIDEMKTSSTLKNFLYFTFPPYKE